MRTFSKIVIVIAALVVVIGVGLMLGWWGSRVKPEMKPAPRVEMKPAPTGSHAPPVVLTPPTPAVTAGPITPPPPTVAAPPAVAPAADPNAPAEWETKLDDILGSADEDTNKVQQLFAMFSQVPPEGQEEVAEHLSNLVSDEDYARLGALMQNPKLPEPVLDVLMNDILNRPNTIKLPLLLQVAQTPDHPHADEAKDLMELYLDEDNPARWPEKMQEWLKENPD